MLDIIMEHIGIESKECLSLSRGRGMKQVLLPKSLQSKIRANELWGRVQLVLDSHSHMWGWGMSVCRTGMPTGAYRRSLWPQRNQHMQEEPEFCMFALLFGKTKSQTAS